MPDFPPEVWAAIVLATIAYYGAVGAWHGLVKVEHKAKAGVVWVIHHVTPHHDPPPDDADDPQLDPQ